MGPGLWLSPLAFPAGPWEDNGQGSLGVDVALASVTEVGWGPLLRRALSFKVKP